MVHEVIESSKLLRAVTIGWLHSARAPLGICLMVGIASAMTRKWGGKRVGEGIRKRNGNGGWKDSRRQSQIGFNHSRLRNCCI